MTIDSHQHFWAYDAERYSWINESMKAIQRDFLPSDLLPILKKNGIDGCIAVQADQSEAETEFLLELAAKNDFIKGVVGWVDLQKSNVRERLEHFSSNKLFKGVRHIVQDEPDEYFMLRPDFQRGIAQLSAFDLAYDILVYQQQLPSAIALVHNFPAQTFVLDHMAKPRISKGLDPGWKLNIKELAKCPNVYCKLSGLVTETKGFNWEKGDFVPFLDTVLEAFGADRVLFGSDWPVCLLAASYGDVKGILDRYMEQRSWVKKDLIFGKNAISAYQLAI